MIRVHTDGAFNLKTKKAGVGIVIINNQDHHQLSIPLEGWNWNNHTAEWQALILALEWLVKNKYTEELILINTDSKVVRDSINNRHTKNKEFAPYLNQCIRLISNFTLVEVRWIPEKENRGADNLAKQALQR